MHVASHVFMLDLEAKWNLMTNFSWFVDGVAWLGQEEKKGKMGKSQTINQTDQQKSILTMERTQSTQRIIKIMMEIMEARLTR